MRLRTPAKTFPFLLAALMMLVSVAVPSAASPTVGARGPAEPDEAAPAPLSAPTSSTIPLPLPDADAAVMDSGPTPSTMPPAPPLPQSAPTTSTGQKNGETQPAPAPPLPRPEPAQEALPRSGATGTVVPALPEFTGESVVDRLHGAITRRLLASAEWMDSFFADPLAVKEENRSYMRFRYEVFQEEYANITTKPAVDLRLALPELERKTHLVFSSEPASPPPGKNAPVGTAGERFGATNQEQLTTALQYIFRTTPKENFIARTGLQFSKLAPAAFIAPRYRLLLPFDVWTIRFTQEVLWNTKTGWQEDTRFDFERPVFTDLFFRTTLDGFWAGRDHGYLYSISFALRQPLDEAHAFDYEWINTYNTRPVNELIEIAFRVRYRQSFLRPWLFFELAPQLRLPRTGNFDALPGILFKLEVFFGKLT